MTSKRVIRNRSIAAGVLLLSAVAGAAGIANATAPAPERVAGISFAHVAWDDNMGNADRSIPRVAHELEAPAMRQIVADTAKELRDAATVYATTFEYERDILVCEQVYVPLLNENAPDYGDDPTALALSECLNRTIDAHDMVAGE